MAPISSLSPPEPASFPRTSAVVRAGSGAGGGPGYSRMSGSALPPPPHPPPPQPRHPRERWPLEAEAQPSAVQVREINEESGAILRQYFSISLISLLRWEPLLVRSYPAWSGSALTPTFQMSTRDKLFTVTLWHICILLWKFFLLAFIYFNAITWLRRNAFKESKAFSSSFKKWN